MNNSLRRLHEGIAATLQERILPYVDDDFARGQVYGVMYLLRYLEMRTDWSDEYLRPQWLALQAAANGLAPILSDLHGAPGVNVLAQLDGSLHQRCEALRTALCDAYDWAERHAGELSPDGLKSIRLVWQKFTEADVKH